jgi:hypothetical protein
MAFAPCSIDAYLILFRRLMSPSYADPLEVEADGFGWDVIRGMAAQFARVEQALNTSQQGYFLQPHSVMTGPQASSGVKASGVVQVSRLAPAGWDLVLPVGTVVEAVITDSYGDDLLVQRYLTTAAATLTSGVLGPIDVAVEAEFVGYDGNAAAGYVSRFQALGTASVRATVLDASTLVVVTSLVNPTDEFQPQFVGRYGRLTTQPGFPALAGATALLPRKIVTAPTTKTATVDPPLDAVDVGKVVVLEVEELADFSVSVAQAAAIAGGVPDGLGAIATDRGTYRHPHETDAQFADRLQLLADVVSPAALERVARRTLAGTGVTWTFVETLAVEEICGFVADVHPCDLPGDWMIPKLPDSELIGQGVYLLDESMATRFFAVLVTGTDAGDIGIFLDATSGPANAADLTGPQQGFLDGYPVAFWSSLARLWSSLNEARAAGVGFAIVQGAT